jgi:hypothetical protein
MIGTSIIVSARDRQFAWACLGFRTCRGFFPSVDAFPSVDEGHSYLCCAFGHFFWAGDGCEFSDEDADEGPRPPYTFAPFFKSGSDELVISFPDNASEIAPELHYWDAMLPILTDMYYSDTGRNATLHNFTTRDDLNEWMYEQAELKTWHTVVMGVRFHESASPFTRFNLTGYYNGTWIRNEEMAARVTLTRLVWKTVFGPETDFRFSVTRLMKKTMDFVFGQLARCSSRAASFPSSHSSSASPSSTSAVKSGST